MSSMESVWAPRSGSSSRHAATALLAGLAAVGVAAGLYRFGLGLKASTNLDHFYPWGLWIVADVSFIALAAGGFVTAAVVHVLHRERYHFLVRPALLTAMLGYTFACLLLAADLGRYYNIWHPILPHMWQGNSALFEVGMCVMTYLVVLYLEFVPIFCQRFVSDRRHPRLSRLCAGVDRIASRCMSFIIVLGVGISCLHQSSLGHIFVLAPTKLHPLWWTPILSLLFLLSAVMTGLPTVILVCLLAGRSFRKPAPMRALGEVAKYLPVVLSIYLAIKVGDLLLRGALVHLMQLSLPSLMLLVELVGGVLGPLILLALPRVRRSPGWLGFAALLVMLGVVINRANVYWIGFQPVGAPHRYVPSLAEWAFTAGMVAALVLLWRLEAARFSIIGWRSDRVTS